MRVLQVYKSKVPLTLQKFHLFVPIGEEFLPETTLNPHYQSAAQEGLSVRPPPHQRGVLVTGDQGVGWKRKSEILD